MVAYTKAKKNNLLKELKQRAVKFIEDLDFYFDEEECSFCPCNPSSLCLSDEQCQEFYGLKRELMYEANYHNNCQLNLEVLRVLLGNRRSKVLINPKEICKHRQNHGVPLFLNIFHYLKISNPRSTKI